MNDTAQKLKFSVKDFFSKCDQIRSKLRICLHLTYWLLLDASHSTKNEVFH